MIDVHRRNERRKTVSLPDENVSAGHSPEDLAVEAEYWAKLKDCVESCLNETERMVFKGNVAGEDAATLAMTLNLTRDRLYRILHDARKKLSLCVFSGDKE
ncbi:MAG: hypothetical protein R3C05_16405 [Pirellulaceae bacterium]